MDKKKLTIIGVLSLIGGILYRLGGKSGFNTKFRDVGVSLIVCLILGIFGKVHTFKVLLSLILTFGLTWLALTTYRYFLPKPTNYKWFHYALHGFFVSFASIPYTWIVGNWLWFGVSCLLCAFGVGLWSHLTSWDELEEGGRGVIISLTRILLIL